MSNLLYRVGLRTIVIPHPGGPKSFLFSGMSCYYIAGMVNELGRLKFKPSWFSVINQEKAIVRDQEQLIFLFLFILQ